MHIGVGGFHRSHQAVYTERLLRLHGSGEWAICGVGLREADRAMQQVLKEQDFLYTVLELEGDGRNSVSVIGAIDDFMLAGDDPNAVLEKLSDPEVRIVSLTITEGGYYIDDNTGLFNKRHPDIQHDLQNPLRPRTAFGYLAEALARRLDRGIEPFTIMSCDSLPHNGDVTRKAMLSFAELRDPALSAWIDEKVAFPNSVLDRITPATNENHKRWLEQAHGIEDIWPVVCEPFMQWVLEDNFCNGRPEWEKVGVQFSQEMTSCEFVKIGLLNAGHIAIAYLGVLAGYRYAHEVMSDQRFVSFLRTFIDQDVAPALGGISGVDIDAYKRAIIDRFSNRHMGDHLRRLCSDGSSKIPKFINPTIFHLLWEGGNLERVALIVASWAQYLRVPDQLADRYVIEDPKVDRLQRAVRSRDQLVKRFFGLTDIFGPDLANSAELVKAFESALARLESRGVLSVLGEMRDDQMELLSLG